jgi:hypothetical protein
VFEGLFYGEIVIKTGVPLLDRNFKVNIGRAA